MEVKQKQWNKQQVNEPKQTKQVQNKGKCKHQKTFTTHLTIVTWLIAGFLMRKSDFTHPEANAK